jgi:hypothetical protein
MDFGVEKPLDATSSDHDLRVMAKMSEKDKAAEKPKCQTGVNGTTESVHPLSER